MSDKQFSAKQCGVHDSFEAENLKVYGDLRHITYQGRYSEKTDHWDAKGFNSLDIATVGFENRFKYITLGVDVSSLPFIKSSLAVHRSDSLFRIGTSIGRGVIDFGNIKWFSEDYSDIVPEISVDWESHLFYRNLSAEFNPGIHHVGISGTYLQSSPRNPSKEYYVRDSINVLLLHGEYGATLGKHHLQLGYSFADANARLYGIFQQEESRKRFMYLPLEARLHLIQAGWEYGSLNTNLNYAHLTGKLSANQDRFYESLAPNRALPSSVLKSLSFSFLQKLFRIDADLDASGIFGGALYQWHFGKKYSINPSAGLEAYYASGTLDIDKKIETLILVTYNEQHEIYTRELKSAGGVASLGLELRREGRVSIALDYGIAQLIPVYISYKEFLPDDNASSDSGNGNSGDGSGKGGSGKGGSSGSKNSGDQQDSKKKSGDLETEKGAAFRNGFATHLGITVRF
jgi:uncharacterized membrane protein YgcG